MSYTGNHRIDAALVVVINDGDGSQCGTPYMGRLRIARYSSAAWPWYSILRKAAPAGGLNRAEVEEGARFLRDYYRDLLKEGA